MSKLKMGKKYNEKIKFLLKVLKEIKTSTFDFATIITNCEKKKNKN